MKTLLIATVLFAGSVGYWDFERAAKEGLPPMYLFERQEETFYGKLKGPCSGQECLNPNNIFNQ